MKKLVWGILSMVCSLAVMAASLPVKAEESISIYKNYMLLHEANIRRLTGNSSSEINVKLVHDLDVNKNQQSSQQVL